jgi:hypothetical protein
VKIILATSAPSADVPLQPWPHKSPHACSVHGFGHAIGADIWEGWNSSEEFETSARGADVVVVNGNTPLLRVFVRLRDVLHGSGTRLVLFQEGDSRPWDTLSPDDLSWWLSAVVVADLCTVYDERYVRRVARLAGGTPVRCVPFPHPQSASVYRIPLCDRENAVFVSSGPFSRRGGLAGLALARAVAPTAQIMIPERHYDAGATDEMTSTVARAYGASLVPWDTYREYVPRLARCKLGISLGAEHTYGRFAADCAAVGVPCVGFSTSPAQRHYWPGLTDIDLDEEALAAFLTDLQAQQETVATADAAAAERTPERIAEAFEAAVGAIP